MKWQLCHMWTARLREEKPTPGPRVSSGDAGGEAPAARPAASPAPGEPGGDPGERAKAPPTPPRGRAFPGDSLHRPLGVRPRGRVPRNGTHRSGVPLGVCPARAACRGGAQRGRGCHRCGHRGGWQHRALTQQGRAPGSLHTAPLRGGPCGEPAAALGAGGVTDLRPKSQGQGCCWAMSPRTDIYIFPSSRISNMAQLVIGKDVHCFEGKNCLHHRVREGQSWKDAEVT